MVEDRTSFCSSWFVELYKIYGQQTILHPCASLRICHAVSKYAHVRFVKEGIPLSSKRPNTPIATTDVLRIQVIQIPPQASEPILSWLHEEINFTSALIHHPLPVTLHVPFGVSGADDWDFGLK